METLSLDRAQRLRIVQRRHGSTRKLAAALNLSHSTVVRVLSGENRKEETRRAIAKACGQSLPKMFGRAA